MTEKQIGRYVIKRELGRGGMATVYLAHDPKIGRDVALKLLPVQFSHDPMFLGRFEREVRAIAAIEHPAIVPIYDYGEQNEQPYLIMRLMSGGTLADRINRGPMALDEVTKVMQRIASALDDAHKKGMIHRDLKPGNIMFDGRGNAYLSDFGIVKLTESSNTFTGTGLIGTPSYMSPEQVQGTLKIDSRSDIYALGVILFQMLTGQAPYKADTPGKMLMAHVLEPVPSLLSANPNIPPDYEKVILKSMAKNRDQRYGTAGTMATDLQAVLDGHPLTVAPDLSQTTVERPTNRSVAPTTPTAKSVGRPRPSWILPAAGIGLLIVAIGIFAGLQIFSSPTPAAPENTATEMPIATSQTQEASTLTPLPAPTETLLPNLLPPAATETSPAATPTLGATPTLATTATSSVILLEIVFSSINVRNGPGANYGIVATLQGGDIVQAIARTDDNAWYVVELETGVLGWISATVGELIDAERADAIPLVATIPPTPMPSATPTVSTYGSSINWIDPFFEDEQSRQFQNNRVLNPIAHLASILVLFTWIANRLLSKTSRWAGKGWRASVRLVARTVVHLITVVLFWIR